MYLVLANSVIPNGTNKQLPWRPGVKYEIRMLFDMDTWNSEDANDAAFILMPKLGFDVPETVSIAEIGIEHSGAIDTELMETAKRCGGAVHMMYWGCEGPRLGVTPIFLRKK